ncbi:AMIN domain-containing protein [Aphanizomenon sp. PH219]|uniref:AMIN domain-containing protein n=1 Tax=Dolichospermum heterosporum TAC447 TaxID=747523 RepID=A0ABY5LSW3_9CYAN|nr:type IV pilus secretin family protein [Dolichospermum heterosporum]MDK2412091.1 AMIN domain-containing protein [Aphanizomenon sp. 202]MDK2462372.1 AMIN domain-containing protein [Aphanizomenon sp. PH219]UUO13681.1 AMIN domain-containing protein [Dolichospermum heterosporum TAC447]
MKQFHNSVFVSSAAACVLLAAQPVLAQLTQITDVKLNPIEGGISVILKTAAGNRPQVFTTKKDKSLIADVINAQLRLPKGDNFRQENPAPGIKTIEVKQLDANSIRVIVTGVDDAPSNQPVMRKDNNLTLGFTTTTNSTASTATKPTEKVSAAPATTPESKPEPGKPPDVLVPNPQVTIDGKIAQSAGPNQPYNQAPPFLPRAVAPPVGDITQSNIDTSPTVIDLGTQERVPRLVLRDAPVREVLSLLARAANLNVVYIGGEAEKAPSAAGGAAGGAETATKSSQTISLDIENEPVQDVFNYVLRLSALEANRTGRTIFVGAKLPNSTRDTVMRSLRLNQVTVGVALNFLVTLGAESAVSRERLVTSVNAVAVEKNAVAPITQTQTTTETKVETQRIDYKDSTPLLRGLQASGDERTNSVTLIGSPKMVEMAVSQLVQLDVRRRQVVVNVKIIDVNLLGIQDTNSSFSFGLGNSFFTNDGGAASFNFGGSRPAKGSELANSVTETPVIPNPVTGAPFFDINSPQTLPGGGPGTTIINTSSQKFTDSSGLVVDSNSIGRVGNTNSTFYKPIVPTSTNPLQPGFSNITQATDNVLTVTDVLDANGFPTGRQTVALSQGTRGTVTAALPPLYQFPKKFLASLTAQVTSGNAKILTDPTLIVQEGQEATVALTSEVYGGIRITPTLREPIIKEAGLTLKVKVERIDDNGFVSLSVAPTVSAPAGTVTTTDGEIGLRSGRSLQSGLLRLRDGQTLILSGIIQDQDRTTVTKLPILGDIPLLGALFRKSNRTNERREVIVLMTPQIMDDSERSSYGYNYTPSPQVRQILERRGLKVQPR